MDTNTAIDVPVQRKTAVVSFEEDTILGDREREKLVPYNQMESDLYLSPADVAKERQATLMKFGLVALLVFAAYQLSKGND